MVFDYSNEISIFLFHICLGYLQLKLEVWLIFILSILIANSLAFKVLSLQYHFTRELSTHTVYKLLCKSEVS
jgi:hypothetical protein